MEWLELEAERAASDRKRIVSLWLSTGHQVQQAHTKLPHGQLPIKRQPKDRLGIGAKPEKSRPLAGESVFAGLEMRKRLTDGDKKHAHFKTVQSNGDSDVEESRAKCVGIRR